MIDKIYNWFLYSSANPEKVALTVRGLIPFLVLLGLDNTLLENTANALIDVIVTIGMSLTAFVTLAGFVRKIFLTFHR